MTDKEKMIFTDLLTEAQPRLYAYILKRMADRHAAKDVLQNANIVIWQKADSFTQGTNFLSWSCTIAHYQMLSYLQKNPRHTSNLVDIFSQTSQKNNGIDENRHRALEECLKGLSPENQILLQTRYSKSKSVNQIAQEQNKSANSISKILHRCRLTLLKCIKSKTAGE